MKNLESELMNSIDPQIKVEIMKKKTRLKKYIYKIQKKLMNTNKNTMKVAANIYNFCPTHQENTMPERQYIKINPTLRSSTAK